MFTNKYNQLKSNHIQQSQFLNQFYLFNANIQLFSNMGKKNCKFAQKILG